MTVNTRLARLKVSSGKRDVGLLLGTRLAVMGMALVSQGVLAHALRAEGRGMYAVCVLFGTLSGVVFAPGVIQGSQYFVMSQRMNAFAALSSAYALCALGTVVAATVMLPLVGTGLPFFENAASVSFYIAFLLVPAATLSTATLQHFAGRRLFTRLSIISLLQSGTVVVLTVALVWVLRLQVNGAIISLLLGHVVAGAAALLLLSRERDLAFPHPSWSGMMNLLRYGLRDYGSSVGLAAESRVSVLVLGFMAGPVDIGLMAISAAIVTRAHIIANAIATYIAPRVAEDPERSSELTARAVSSALWVTSLALAGWIAISRTAVEMLLPDEFAPVTQLTWIMSLGVCAAAASEVLIAYFRASDLPGLTSLAVCTGLLASAGLLIVLYPWFGIYGAAWAVSGGNICRGVFLSGAFIHRSGLSIGSIVLIRRPDFVGLFRAAKHLLGNRV